MSRNEPDAATDVAARDLIRRGDERRGLELLMNSYGERLHRYCAWLLGDRALAEDVVQTAFCELYSTFKNDAGGPFYAWLHRTARNDCLDHLKSPRAKVLSADGAAEQQDASGTPEELLLDHESEERESRRLAALQGCIKKLPHAQRPIVVMRFFEKLSYPEISTFFKEHPATLQARATAALRALRLCLEQNGASP